MRNTQRQHELTAFEPSPEKNRTNKRARRAAEEGSASAVAREKRTPNRAEQNPNAAERGASPPGRYRVRPSRREDERKADASSRHHPRATNRWTKFFTIQRTPTNRKPITQRPYVKFEGVKNPVKNPVNKKVKTKELRAVLYRLRPCFVASSAASVARQRARMTKIKCRSKDEARNPKRFAIRSFDIPSTFDFRHSVFEI
jgi:hypothetical protein